MSASAGIDNNLPPEITEAILCFLPAKSLGRFKSVSKTWTSLICDPRFIKHHVHKIQNNHHLKITNLIVKTRFVDTHLRTRNSLNSISTKELLPLVNIPVAAKELSFGSPPIYISKILGSCNRVVLASAHLQEGDMVLINPTTQELWNVPSPPFEFGTPCYGFGYDSFTDDYKVVYITDTETSYMHASVYSLRKSSWKILPNSPHLDAAAGDLCSGALVNHICHWSATRSTILTLSLADEVFNVIILPDIMDTEKAYSYDVVELGGKLALYLKTGVDYELGNCKSWTWVWSMSNSVLSEKFEVLHTPVCFVEGSNECIVMVGEGGIVFYIDEDERRYKTIQIKGGLVIFDIGGTFVESIESLARFVTTP